MGGGGIVVAAWWARVGLQARAAQYCKDVAVGGVVAGLVFNLGRWHPGL